MKRIKIVTAKDSDIKVSITVAAESGHSLMRDEITTLVDELASSSMQCIVDAPYVHCPLSKIKVK